MRISMPPLTRRCLLAVLAALTAGAVSPLLPGPAARAIPPPSPEGDLAERSQLVVLADVLGVACTGRLESGRLRYSAWVQVIRTEKGDAAPLATLQIAWLAADPNLLGSWEVRAYPGDRLKLYLILEEKTATWKAFHPSGAVAVVRVPKEQRKLPKNPGEVLFRPATAPAPPAAPDDRPPTTAPAQPPASEPH